MIVDTIKEIPQKSTPLHLITIATYPKKRGNVRHIHLVNVLFFFFCMCVPASTLDVCTTTLAPLSFSLPQRYKNPKQKKSFIESLQFFFTHFPGYFTMDTSSLPLLCRRKSLCTATQNTHKMTHAPDTVIPTGQTCHGADGSAVLEVQHDTDPTAPDGVVADVVSLPTHVVAQQSPSPQVCSLPKDFANALVLLPPDELLTAIQPLRKRYDPAYTRWMPHVNVLWPFPCAEHHAVCARAAAAVLENIPPFEVCFWIFCCETCCSLLFCEFPCSYPFKRHICTGSSERFRQLHKGRQGWAGFPPPNRR